MDRQMKVIENFEDYTDWTLLSNDTETLAALTKGVFDQKSIEFDKKDGTDNWTMGGAYKDISGEDVAAGFWDGNFTIEDDICLAFYVGAITNIAYASVRLGTDASHYAEWRFHDSQMQASSWHVLRCPIGFCAQVGNGADMDDLSYLAVGVEFDAAGNALADIGINLLFLNKSQRGLTVPVLD